MLLKIGKLYFIFYVIFIFFIAASFGIGVNYVKVISLLDIVILLLLIIYQADNLKKIISFSLKIYYIYYLIYILLLVIFFQDFLSVSKILIYTSFLVIIYIFSNLKSFKLLKLNYLIILILLLHTFILNPPSFYLNVMYYFLHRYSGIYGANEVGMLSVFLGLYSLFFYKISRKKIYVLFLLIAFFIIFMTGSRASLLSLVIGLFLYNFPISKKLLVLSFILEIILIFFATDIFNFMINIVQNNQDKLIMKLFRFDLFSIKLRLEGSLLSAYEISKNHNFFPLGLNTVNIIKDTRHIFIDNSYLSILLETGILGLFLIVIFLVRLLFLIDKEYLFLYFPVISILFFFENIWSFNIFNILALSLWGIVLKGNVCKK